MLTQVADKLLEELSDPSADFVVVVEGKKDVEALRRLGILRVEMLNHYPSVVDMADALAEKGIKRAVILTDYDRTGKALAYKLGAALMSAGIHVDWKARAKIRREFHVTYIENLDRIVEAMERGEKNGKNIYRLGKVSHSRKH
ncbi:MAG: dTMP kinase [Candidatus Diapherotrites archaeon]|nr:dTMP kinase [Candidatus Diapherotrites archaeon]